MRNFFILALLLAGIICILLAIFQDMPMWAILSIIGYTAIKIAQGIDDVDWNRHKHVANQLSWMERRFLEIEDKIDGLATQVYEIKKLV